MSPLTNLFVLLSLLPFMVDTQSNKCPTPSKQRPTTPFYNENVIQFRFTDAQMVSIIQANLQSSQEQPSIPILTVFSPGQNQGHTASLWISATESFVFTDNQLVHYGTGSSVTTEQVTNHFNFRTNTFNVIASTRTSNSIVLVVRNTANGQVTNAVFSQTRMNGKFQLISQSSQFIHTTLLPNAITAFENKYEQFVVFFDIFWTVISSNQLNQLYLLDLQNTNQFRLSRTWVGCPVDLCFEGDLDAAVNLNGQLTVYRGQYSWDLNIATQLTTIRDIPSVMVYYMDAAFTWSSGYNFVVNNQIVSGNVTFSMINAPSITDFPISAAFVNDSTVVMLSGTRFNEYNVISGLLTRQNNGQIDEKWPGLPDNIDAAVELTAQNEVIFFKGSYHYKSNINGGPVVPSLTMNTLYQCTDTFYGSYTNDVGIATWAEFQTYIKKYEPNVRTSPSKLKSDTKDRRKTIIIVISAVAGILVLASGLVILVRIKRKQAQMDSSKADFSVADTTIQTIESENTTVVNVANIS